MSDMDNVLGLLLDTGTMTVAAIADDLEWSHQRVRTALLAAEDRGLARR